MTAFSGLLGAGVFLAVLAATLAACGVLTVTLRRPAPRRDRAKEGSAT